MPMFFPVKYRNKSYPDNIHCPIQEIAGHLDKTQIEATCPYSLHTEYAYGKRDLSSVLLNKFPTLRTANQKGIPQLWFNEKWAEEFAFFILELTSNHPTPVVIEIHPPFQDYCPTIHDFFTRYKIFENIIQSKFPDTKICLENRAGTLYRGRKFLVSKFRDVERVLQYLNSTQHILQIVLDYPQLFTAEHFDLSDFPINDFEEKHKTLQPFKDRIAGIHIWGKSMNSMGRQISHSGDLNSLFADNLVIKSRFLSFINNFYEDNRIRFFVPEVNSSEAHLQSIVLDFINAGVKFVYKNLNEKIN